MKQHVIWQLVNNVTNLSGGIILSATDENFSLKDLKTNTILFCLPFKDFISDTYKYPNEIFTKIASKLDFNCDTVFYDNLSKNKICELCEKNRLLF